MSENNYFPKRIYVELTNCCNLQCNFCPRHYSKMKLGYMSDKLFYKIVDEASKFSQVTLVIFFRGESLLHPRIIKFIEYAKQKGIEQIELASNGLLLSSEIGEKLIRAGLDFISFSIDTNNPSTYARNRINGNLEKSINNVITFSGKCLEMKKKGQKVPVVQVSTVDIEEYRKDQKQFINFWLKFVDRVRVYVEHSKGGDYGSMRNLVLNMKRKKCNKLYNEMTIYWNGSVALCCYDWDNNLSFPNVLNTSIEEIWDSIEYRKIRSMHEKMEIDKEGVCYQCDQWKIDYTREGYLGKTYTKLHRLNMNRK